MPNLITRTAKGSPLTVQEMDDNLLLLQSGYPVTTGGVALQPYTRHVLDSSSVYTISGPGVYEINAPVAGATLRYSTKDVLIDTACYNFRFVVGAQAAWTTATKLSEIIGIDRSAVKNGDTNLGISGHTTGAMILTSSTGIGVSVPIASGSLAGLMTGAQFTKLAGIAAGAQVNVPTNLDRSPGTTTVSLTSSTGTGTTLPAATQTAAGVLTAADKVKLDGVATGATVDWVSTRILASTDLNTRVTEGAFNCPSNADAATMVNCPTTKAFSLRVWAAAGIIQELTEYASGNTVECAQWRRGMYNNVWSPWFRLYSEGFKPTAADIGAQPTLPAGTNGQVLKHNGTDWVAGTDNNTTYSAMSQAEAEAGTATSGRVLTAAVLKAAVAAHAPAELPAGTAGQVLKHNGTAWVAGTDDNTSYGTMSQAEAEAGTATTARVVTAAVIKAAVIKFAPAFAGGTVAGAVSITNSTASTSATTGALIVTGGVGVGGAVFSTGAITSAGNVTAYSDERLKEDLQRVDYALERLSCLTGYTYRRKDSGERQAGLIAQDVQSVLPEVVQENADGYLSVAYGNLLALVINAVNELHEIVKGQKT